MKNRKDLLLLISTIIAGLVGGALFNVFFMSGTSFAQVTKQHEKFLAAQEFRLVDASGKLRANFAAGALGGVSLDLYDADNKSRIALSLSSKGTPSLKLSGGAAIELKDKNDRVRMKINTLSDGSPTMRFFDEKGAIRAIFGGVNLETPAVARIESIEKRDEASLVFINTDSKVSWSAP